MPHVEIYTDGGCEPNPGPGGYGVVLLHSKKRAQANGGFRLTTNSRMEIYAAIKGLELLMQACLAPAMPSFAKPANKPGLHHLGQNRIAQQHEGQIQPEQRRERDEPERVRQRRYRQPGAGRYDN